MHASAPPIVAAPRSPAVLRRYWTKDEYNAAVDAGVLTPASKVYLSRGELIDVMSIGFEHRTAVCNSGDWCVEAFGPLFRTCVQMPLDVPGDSMPEPDVSVVTHAEFARRPHPSTALLVIEVSFTTHREDRAKAAEYAAAGVADYWLLDLVRRVLEVRRDVVDDPASPTGKSYATLLTFGEDDAVAPLASPDVRVTPRALMDGAA